MIRNVTLYSRSHDGATLKQSGEKATIERIVREMAANPSIAAAVLHDVVSPDDASAMHDDLAQRVGMKHRSDINLKITIRGSLSQLRPRGEGSKVISEEEYAAEAVDQWPLVRESQFNERFRSALAFAPELVRGETKSLWLSARTLVHGAAFKTHFDALDRNPEFGVSTILSFVLVCSMPPEGGMLYVHIADGLQSVTLREQRRLANAGVETADLRTPEPIPCPVGSAFLLNGTYYHGVTAARGGCRRSMGTFFGVMNDGSIRRFQ